MIRSLTQRIAKEDSGSGLIEYGLSTSVMLMVIFGLLDMSRALYADHYVSNVAREATRYAMVRGATWNGAACTTPSTFSCTATATDIANYVTSDTPPGFSASSLTVNATWPGTTASGATCSATGVNNTPGCIVTVQVTYNFNVNLPFLPANVFTLSSTSSRIIAQ
jgi:Flp pilus assembly protein TadG